VEILGSGRITANPEVTQLVDGFCPDLATRSRVRKVVIDTGAADFAERTAALPRGVVSQGPVSAVSCAGDLMQSNPIILRISIDSKRSALRASLLEVSRPF
jgi:hypothetical protein